MVAQVGQFYSDEMGQYYSGANNFSDIRFNSGTLTAVAGQPMTEFAVNPNLSVRNEQPWPSCPNTTPALAARTFAAAVNRGYLAGSVGFGGGPDRRYSAVAARS